MIIIFKTSISSFKFVVNIHFEWCKQIIP